MMLRRSALSPQSDAKEHLLGGCLETLLVVIVGRKIIEWSQQVTDMVAD